MALLARSKPSEGDKLDKDTQSRLDRGRARHKYWKPRWAETLAFVEGRQFVFKSNAVGQNSVNELDATEGGAKPAWKARTTRNRLLGLYLAEVSMGTQRVPQYEVTPSNTDPEVVSAARLAEKVLFYLYNHLGLRQKLVEAYGYAVSCGEGFLRPYWDPTAGDPLPPDDENPEEQLYTGELCVDSYGPQEVYWEPGVRFEDSPWHAIDQSKTIDEVKALAGYLGGDLKPDARGSDSFVSGQLDKSAVKGDMVRLTEYLERPSRQNKWGRRLFIANDRVVTPPEAYPSRVVGPKGVEACILKITFIPTPWRDRDMGIVEHAIDAQRTVNDSTNKSIEAKNLILIPRLVTGSSGIRDRLTDQPGSMVRSKGPVDQVKWIDVPPGIMDPLFQMARQAVEDMEAIFAQRQLPPGVDAAKAMATWIEQQNAIKQFIIANLADVHSRLGMHLLWNVQQYFTEPRLLAIQGRHGLEYIPDFKGADLKNQISVTVNPGSISPRTRGDIEQKVMGYADRGWITPQQAMAAIDGGYSEDLLEDYELDVSRADRENQQMLAMGTELLPGGDVPIAQDYDNHPVHLHRHTTWMKTREFEEAGPMTQEAARLHVQQHKMLEAQQQAQQQAQQIQTAQQLGMANATRPPSAGMPDLPSLTQ